MKKALMVLFVFVSVLIVVSCQKNSPSSPAAPAATDTPTPNATLTAEALQTAGPSAQATATAQAAIVQATETAQAAIAQATATAQAVETAAYESFYATETAIVVITSTAIALQTAGPAAQATATAVAFATENMQQFQATQTAITAATQTVVVAATQTAVVVATQTAAAVMATQTVVAVVATQTAAAMMATQTVVAVVATQTAVAEAATQTAAVVATQTAVVAATQTAVAAAATQTAAVIYATQTEVAAVATQTAEVVQTQTAIAAIPYTDLASVPGGTYTQTDTIGNSFSHTISAFKLGTYQVTYNLWYAVYQWAVSNGYTFVNAGWEGSSGAGSGHEPVTAVTCRDVIVWCNAYSQETGLTSIYYSDAAFTTPIKSSIDAAYSSSIDPTVGGLDDPYVNWSANGYRLPTEGEYQYAASYINGLSWTPYNYASGATADYTNATATGLVAWTNCSSTQVVGGKIANALGIYDMSGNVKEWCWDLYGAYPTTAQTNYRGPTSVSFYNGRVMRGGDFFNGAVYLQVGYRLNGYPYYADGAYGFRFARTY
jgi:hypothetical protein